MAKDDHRELGIEVKNPGDEVGGLGERSHRVVIISLIPVPKEEGFCASWSKYNRDAIQRIRVCNSKTLRFQRNTAIQQYTVKIEVENKKDLYRRCIAVLQYCIPKNVEI